ncbi:Transketolase (plasmid) [Variovorax sp. WDL1]|nr:Transketolase [Variovorax sp. WDL1]PNG48995.1 Transketolase [Variovorax sp. B4]PNG49727.1 Transketolase [Variovorax sp. B2]VTV18570.1 Transketolase [Variovorax sp. WDL1]
MYYHREPVSQGELGLMRRIDELHLDGAPAVSLDDIRQFRQLGSKTPGHPEYRMTTGVETTTGPLGQGCGNSVGMAIAQRALAARFNRDGFTLFDHDVYVLCGDGDMMEGVSGEAASIAGHLALSRLCWIYDSNRISIEGSTQIAFTEDVGKRFEAYGWNVLHVDDANDTQAIAEALANFRNTRDRPTFIVVRSVIGWGSPRAGSEKAHGEALGADNVRATKKGYGWPEDAQFLVPDASPKPSTPRLRSAARRRAKLGSPPSSATARPSRRKQPSSICCARAGWPKAGMRMCPASRPMRKASPRAMRAARC